MPQKTEDEPTRDVEASATVLKRAMDARDHGLEGHAPIGVGLWIEEDLGVAHALGGGPHQVRPGQVVEILFLQEHSAARVIDVEERLQIAEHVRPSNVLERSVRQTN